MPVIVIGTKLSSPELSETSGGLRYLSNWEGRRIRASTRNSYCYRYLRPLGPNLWEERSMKKALVTGATGFVGSFMCRELVTHGYKVRILRRASSALTNLEGVAVEEIEGDLTERDAVIAACKGQDLVFHIGALYRQAKFPDQVYWEVNLEGTRNVLDGAEMHGVSRVLHCSTIGVHSHIANPPADEREPYAPTDLYQETKVAAEKLVLQYVQERKMDAVVIRPAMIWGPRDTRFLKMFRGIARRRMPIIGDGKNLTHWILVTDLVRAFRLAGETPTARGEVFIIAGERPVTLEYTYQKIAEAFDVRLLPFKIPVWPFQALGSGVEALCRPLGIEPPIHRRRADFFIKNRAFNCSKAQRMLDFSPTQTFEAEVVLIAEWYRQHGWA